MTDRTEPLIVAMSGLIDSRPYVIASGVSLVGGCLAQLTDGHADHWDGTGQFLGVVDAIDDIESLGRSGDPVVGNPSSLNPPKVRCTVGATLMHVAVGGSVEQIHVGQLVYCADSDLAGLTRTDLDIPPVGRLVRVRSASDCDVRTFSPTEFLAGIASGTWAS